jgi:alkylation response protein AidB-like acyl-CoA dehydrogenase
MKFYSDIEPLRVFAERVSDGYVINGSLPWVSNIENDHYFGVVFEMKGKPEHRVMAMVQCDQPGVKLCDGGRFIALEGSATWATRFDDCFIPDEFVLADPADEYIKAIRPGFVLMQVGMGIGLVRSCAAIMRKQDKTHWHVNQFLTHADELEEQADELLERTKQLAQTPHETSRDFVVQTLQARLDAGELSMAAAQACMLNGGARAYAEKSNQNRKLRESYFVGVVTPATKHLRKEIARLTA